MVLALMDQESDYREKVISKTNDYGIMQINKVNHEWLKEELGIEDFLEAEQNILAGIRMLAGLAAKYEDPHLVLMAYNCGENGAKKLWKQGKTTSQYSRSIMARAEELRKEAEECQQYAVSVNGH
jgi:soluble lytic murein transglycosylase-like protein